MARQWRAISYLRIWLPSVRTINAGPNVIERAGTIGAFMDFRRTMPRRPTRFEILIPQLTKEAEADDAAEPPSQGYQVTGRFHPDSWPMSSVAVSVASTDQTAFKRK
jgi:hypothetical protein